MATALSNLKIAVKLPLIMVTLAVINALIGGYFAITAAEEEAVKSAETKLEAVRNDYAKSLERFLESINEDVILLSDNDYVRQALRDFSNGWQSIEGDKSATLLKLYRDDNPAKLGDKEKFDQAPDGSLYSAVHLKYHPWFREFMEKRAYYDVFLFDRDGNIVYTVEKEPDFATNAENGPWKDTDLMSMFREIKSSHGKIIFRDFKPYEPSDNVPAAFIGRSITDSNGNFLGAFAIQMPVARMTELALIEEGLGKSGKVEIVGADKYLRNDPHPDDGKDVILKEQNVSEAVEKALKGEKLVQWDRDEGQSVMVAARPVQFNGVTWVVAPHMLEEEILEHVKETKIHQFLSSAIVLSIIALITFLYSRQLTRPINAMVDTMGTLANGDYNASVPSLDRRDEIGSMARAVQVFKENGQAMQQMQLEQENLKKRAEEDKRIAMNKLADDFDARTAGVIKSLAQAATAMQAAAQQLNTASQTTAHASGIVAAAATEADSNVQTVASAAEELSASSAEIAKQVSSVASRASQASREADVTSREVRELNTLADSIGEVVSAIKDIAEQTNLLALNATIEAARAGEAGKGFAVVADEVKKLAMETGQKTEQIDERVVRIQQAIRTSVDAVQRIINEVQQIDEATTTVASAVEEQNAATAEIGRNVTEASTGTQQVAHTITEVQKNATDTGQSAQSVLITADELATISASLQREVVSFLSSIRNS